MMLGLAFLNPLLLWALPLAAVPIIIHILNRRRFTKVPWAAMGVPWFAIGVPWACAGVRHEGAMGHCAGAMCSKIAPITPSLEITRDHVFYGFQNPITPYVSDSFFAMVPSVVRGSFVIKFFFLWLLGVDFFVVHIVIRAI